MLGLGKAKEYTAKGRHAKLQRQRGGDEASGIKLRKDELARLEKDRIRKEQYRIKHRIVDIPEVPRIGVVSSTGSERAAHERALKTQKEIVRLRVKLLRYVGMSTMSKSQQKRMTRLSNQLDDAMRTFDADVRKLGRRR